MNSRSTQCRRRQHRACRPSGLRGVSGTAPVCTSDTYAHVIDAMSGKRCADLAAPFAACGQPSR
jgi:hypothetical protein